ncbi:MAG TPA: bifunctional UDP-N-acetylglucosamine diphosphorylase/glucosamine-1-phosphate N-acetyltransferase GlmU [Candidatus Binatia bacterium]|nr:bifunctional UDP-N-acetylglucosamine diphosphorylase/glucosamine-1-phosphate N-acetyltransferase GlmU [Candidatus Binatia bacterium]
MTSRTGPSGRTVAVVLAAGLGTRMRSRTPKILHPLCGRPMLAYVLDAWDDAQAALDDQDGSEGPPGNGPPGKRPPGKGTPAKPGNPNGRAAPIVVYSPATEAIRDIVGDRGRLALQEVPRGTGDAVRAALGHVPDDAEEVLVLSGDVPLVRGEQLVAVVEQRRLDDAAITLASVYAADPGELGRVVRSEFGSVERIVEARDATPEELETNEVNAGLYAFDAAWLRRRIGSLRPSRSNRELYLTDLVALAREDGRIVSAVGFEDDGTLDGINDRSQLAQAEWALRVRINESHMRDGVTMRDPSTVYLDWEVELAPDVVLEPNVHLRGATKVGAGSTIGPGAFIDASTIGANVRVWLSVVEQATIEDGVTVGPYSHLRPGSHVGAGSEIGNFAEIKKSRLGRRVKQHHVSYLGDAELGDGTNVGAGTITANWDGRAKNRTTIGANAFLGVDTMLVAPVTVGDGAKTGAGAVVTKDVPPGKLAVGVPARIREPRQRPPAATGGPGPARSAGQRAGHADKG